MLVSMENRGRASYVINIYYGYFVFILIDSLAYENLAAHWSSNISCPGNCEWGHLKEILTTIW